MRRSRIAHRGRAFSLTELLIACMLLGVVGLVGTRAFHLAFHTTQQAEAAQTMMAQWEQMTRLLGQDMWAAQSWTVTGDRALTIRHADATVAWAVEDDGTVSRRLQRGQAREEHRWTQLRRSVRFAADGPQLLLKADAPGTQTEQQHFAPALSLLEPQP